MRMAARMAIKIGVRPTKGKTGGAFSWTDGLATRRCEGEDALHAPAGR